MLRLKVFMLCLVCPGLVIAQAENMPSDSTTSTSLPTDSDLSPPAQEATEAVISEPAIEPEANSQRGNRGDDDQVFIPSEEISEDRPVPFPTDI
ncbi:MAG: hypothetical protein HKN85_04555 [Gammaproteobacteria bacterium]|nr:hypothetical protein [Gammaproteobacteria bacterium]